MSGGGEGEEYKFHKNIGNYENSINVNILVRGEGGGVKFRDCFGYHWMREKVVD